MIWRATLLLLSLSAIVVLIAGVVSFWMDIPVCRSGTWNIKVEDGGIEAIRHPPNTMYTIMLLAERWPWGYAWHRPDRQLDGSPTYWIFAFIPFWEPFLLLAALPLVACGVHLWRRKRRKEGYCVHCGYDLTGNVTGVCPECGEETGLSGTSGAGPSGRLWPTSNCHQL